MSGQVKFANGTCISAGGRARGRNKREAGHPGRSVPAYSATM
jgi:hypothetical protein